MSSRQPADRSRIELFLRRLAERFRRPGRIYLVGGTTMVYEGWRAQSLDVDLTFEVEPADHDAIMQTIRELKDQLALNVEEASPGDFIPLPAGYRDRAEYVGRYGQLDVFHFDLYSTALSKIARGAEEDLSDVLALLRAGRLELAALEQRYQEIRPQFATRSLKPDPKELDRNFQAVRDMWARG
ncbi:MAG: hypothetical protein HY782_01480 [Chloroflexi bacterium]|nr:hypothetical protein [Chloroflexota bacterium]